MTDPHVLSAGLGVNTKALLLWLIDNDKPLDAVVFADTGDEKPETYEELPFYEAKCAEIGVPFITVRSHRYPLSADYARLEKIPFRMSRSCTGNFKIAPIQRWIHETYPGTTTWTMVDGKRQYDTVVQMYIGIAYDEVHRVRDSLVGYSRNIFPLVDAKVDRDRCKAIILAHGETTPVKSGCYLCPFAPKREFQRLYQVHPDLFIKAMELEEASTGFPNQTLGPWGPLRRLKDAMDCQTSLDGFLDNDGDQCCFDGRMAFTQSELELGVDEEWVNKPW